MQDVDTQEGIIKAAVEPVVLHGDEGTWEG